MRDIEDSIYGTNLTEYGNYRDWIRIDGDRIPSSVEIFPLLYDKLTIGERIIDIGCGLGRTSFDLLARKFGPIIGIDINKSAIELARSKLVKMENNLRTQCSFELMDALNTSFEDGYFKYGIMQAFLTTMTTPVDRIEVLKEARRIISKTGGLYVADFIQTWHNGEIRRRYEDGQKETGEACTFRVYDKETNEFMYLAHHYSRNELKSLFLKAGFRVDSFHNTVLNTRSGNRVNGAIIWAI